jgi:predicted metal-dependent HD superfamily phosphohydrolase
MDPTGIERWLATCARLGLRNVDSEHRKLLRTWKSWGRHYHSQKHLDACLRQFSSAHFLAAEPAEVELALWFHDAIYRSWRRDNELRSSVWAHMFVVTHGGRHDVAARVSSHVMATAHVEGPLSGDAALVVDIDLSILGQPRTVYDEFETNVRREYWWVPKRRYAAARTAVLKSFLDRPSIYHLEMFRERYEVPARENLTHAVAALVAQ